MGGATEDGPGGPGKFSPNKRPLDEAAQGMGKRMLEGFLGHEMPDDHIVTEGDVQYAEMRRQYTDISDVPVGAVADLVDLTDIDRV